MSKLYKDGGSTSVILEMSLCAACVILRQSQSLVSPLQLLATYDCRFYVQ